MKSVHIGQKVKEVSKREGYTATAFGALINMGRDGVNKIFKKKYLDTELLQTISTKLKHDFFAYLSQDLGLLREPKEPFGVVTREEFRDVIEKLNKRFDDIEDRLPIKKGPSKKKYKREPKTK